MEQVTKGHLNRRAGRSGLQEISQDYIVKDFLSLCLGAKLYSRWDKKSSKIWREVREPSVSFQGYCQLQPGVTLWRGESLDLNKQMGAGERERLPALPEDPSSVPRIHIRQRTTTWISSSSWLQGHLHTHGIYSHKHIHVSKIKTNLEKQTGHGWQRRMVSRMIMIES